ncbi:PQQ-dependent sugar dehydrogenase [Microvirga guangxiensis]|uniref:Glucose/arabinose dehydrogenase, beta-propeller fold n=1 Tax=Microvirga guangxiensis TaxID=549386 RepID=A0A1G5JZC7_9HYPH|nr:PQQ-dependent sugar dehydrogenase [Microvirga guangxiensis]SCY92959.1 Glucose/arabinose dehydrogenase, beta-propeller fold [Microvirga guangxiensis]
MFNQRRLTHRLAIGFLISLAAGPASAVPGDDGAPILPETSDGLIPVRVAGPFEFPWSIGFLPDGLFLVTEKPGRLRLVRPGSRPREIMGLPAIRTGDQGGLLDVAVDPDFTRTGTVYLSYTHGTQDASTVRILKARLELKTRRLLDQAVLFESDPPASANEQLGGRLALTSDGFLFLSLGDRWEPQRAQDLSDHAGSIIRIRTDGSVPDTNPFVAVPGAKPEIWSYGHRNPQGLVGDDRTGALWATEHGPQGGDELNLIQPGRNYGWPLVSHGLNYDGSPVGSGIAVAPEIEGPAYVWVPSIAPSGLTMLRDGEQASIVSGALAGQMVVRLSIAGNSVIAEQRLLEGILGRVRDVRLGPDGSLYAITDDPEGHLYRLLPATEQARRASGRPPL